MYEWSDFSYSKSPFCRKPFIKFLLKRIYLLEEDVGLRIKRWRFYCTAIFDEWIFAVSGSPCCQNLLSSFYSRWYMVWKMVVEEVQDDCLVHDHLWCVNGVILAILSLSVGGSLPSSFYMVWKRCLKNNKIAFKLLAIFDFWMEWFYLFWVPMLHDAPPPPIKFSGQENLRVERSCLKKSKMVV